jgi:metalloprotease
MSRKNVKFSDRNPEVSIGQLLILGGIFLTIIVTIIVIIWFLLNSLINFIPPQFEQTLGSIIVPIYQEKSEDSPIQDTLNQLLDQLETHLLDQPDRDYQVFYIPENTINALAIPGDRIIIYQGLLQEMDSENELMMVLGHELGHFAHRDHLRSLGKIILVKGLLSYFLGDLSNLAIIVENISNAQFSQTQETKADQFGLNLLYLNYNQVAGATDFFEKLSQKQALNWSFLATHPAPEKRVKQLQKLIEKQGYSLGEKTPLPDTLKLEKTPDLSSNNIPNYKMSCLTHC